MEQFSAQCFQQDNNNPTASDKARAEHVTLARMAVLMQMLAVESPAHRLGLVNYLSQIPHAESTRMLARLAIFSAEEEIRLAAIASLKVRREKDYNDILLKGLRYPLPAVAKRTAEAMVRMDRSDLIPELLAVLEEPDPRLPQNKTASDGKECTVVREVVKVNHNRNCMMCHAPAPAKLQVSPVVPPTPVAPTSGAVSPVFGMNGTVTLPVASNALMVEVPVPGQPIPTQPGGGYGQSFPDLMIRVDVTYLRQDFSLVQAVADAHPWPELQRFDYLVRERKMTLEEAATYRDKLMPKEEGVLSPYHRATLAALRELTGKDTSPTVEAWRKLLGMPAK